LKTNEYSSKKVRPKFRKQEPILTRGVMYMHGVKLLEERVGLIRLNSFTRHLAEKKSFATYKAASLFFQSCITNTFINVTVVIFSYIHINKNEVSE